VSSSVGQPLSGALLRALPKTDLHVHLDGSLRPRTVRELAATVAESRKFADDDEVRQVCTVSPDCSSLEDYLRIFDITLPLLQTRAALERTACELAEDAHRENVRYLEVRYSPLLHTRAGLAPDDVVAAVQAGLDRAHHRYGVLAGQIVCGLRHIAATTSLELAKLAVRWKGRGVVGFDLAGAERDYPAKDHREAFYRVRNANMGVTVHAGEAFGAPSIHQAVHYCGAHRIGHGTHLIEDRDLLAWVNDHRIAVEACLVSNVQTRAVPDLGSHPIAAFLDEGLRVTLNTDNRLVSATTVTDEYRQAVATFGLDRDDVLTLIVNGFKAAFLPLRAKIALIEKVLAEFRALDVGFTREIAERRRVHF